MHHNEGSRSLSVTILFLSIIAFVILSGCISQPPEVLSRKTPAPLQQPQNTQPPEVLKVNPEIDWNTQVGFNKSEGTFTIIKGSIPEVKESLREPPQQSVFSINDSLNIIVFRGVFSKAGHGIEIDKVERQGNTFTVHANYTDWNADVPVETHPTAIIPIGRLATGDYEARLRVTKVVINVNETNVFERKVVESEKEISVFNFKVREN